MAACHLPKATMMSTSFLNFLQFYLKTDTLKEIKLVDCDKVLWNFVTMLNQDMRTPPTMSASIGHRCDAICWLTIAGQFHVLKETVPKIPRRSSADLVDQLGLRRKAPSSPLLACSDDHLWLMTPVHFRWYSSPFWLHAWPLFICLWQTCDDNFRPVRRFPTI